MGQLQDAGNTTTLAHYLQLLTTAGMVTGLPKYMGRFIRQRAASPKLQVFNTALLTAQFGSAFFEAQKNSTFWGRLVEASVGAYLLNSALVHGMTLYYWRDGQDEVDFVLEWQKKQVAIEVKSYTTPHKPSGMKAFCQHYPQVRSLVIDGQNLTLERFLTTPITQWFVVE
jgi:predicted AAA+ superfamily ATPase